MTSEEALNHFLGVFPKRWRCRYRSLLGTKKGKETFLNDLWHQFEKRIDEAKVVQDIPQKAWSLPAFSFSGNGEFGKKEKSIQDAFSSIGDGSLIIDSTGKYGIYQPEDMVDDIKYIII